MKTITLTSLALATLLTALPNAANASDWQDYVAQERGYPNHEEMQRVYNDARENSTYWQMRLEEQRKKEEDDNNQRYRSLDDQ